ncbi:MAG: T9SS type A sorting domain-containing protein [Bacteroidetes bacterium]|nr:T9SS type A sorting domain-containing protein [Bacteroidota bacterium]
MERSWPSDGNGELHQYLTVNPAPVPTIGSTNNPCIGSTNNIYYTESGMTVYVWTVPTGGTIVTGQGTNTVNVTWNQQGVHTVTVNYNNASGCSAAQPTVYTVFVNSPPDPAGAITGPVTMCAGTNGLVYTTTPVVGATSYSWYVTGGTIISGAGTTSITVNIDPAAVSGSVTVAGNNQCGNGTVTTLPLTINPIPAAPVVTLLQPTPPFILSSSAPAGNQWYNGSGAIPGATGQTFTATNYTGWYWCVVTLNGCSSDTSNHVWADVHTGQEEITANATFAVYPVPNDGRFNVSISTSVQETYTIQVFNLIGEKFYELKDATTVGGKFDARIDLGLVARGIYSVVFLNSEHRIVRKMIVNR